MQGERCTHMAIIGNGFEIAHGYKTSYKDSLTRRGRFLLRIYMSKYL